MSHRIVQLSDCHLFSDPATLLKGINTRSCFERVLRMIRQEFAQADAVVITGDLAHDERSETYLALRELLHAEWDRLRIIPGNHDNRPAMRDVFGDRILPWRDRNVFEFSLGSWRLIGLDSQVPGSLHGELGANQLTWLEESLRSRLSQPTLLFVHHPPVDVDSEWLDRIGLTDRDSLREIVKRHPQIRAICAGHVHQELTAMFESAVLLTTPSTAVQFRPLRSMLEVDSIACGFRVLDLFDNGSFRTRVVRVNE